MHVHVDYLTKEHQDLKTYQSTYWHNMSHALTSVTCIGKTTVKQNKIIIMLYIAVNHIIIFNSLAKYLQKH